MPDEKSVVKLLLMGDRHNTETTPPSRLGNFRADCDAKDDFIIALAQQENVDAIVHPGDFWNNVEKKPSNEFIGSVAAKWVNAGIPIIGIAGNHDMIGGDPDTIPYTIAGLMDTLNVLPILRNGEEYHIRKGDIDFCITGTSFHKNQDKPGNIGDYIIPAKKGTYHMHVVHGMLTPTDLGQKIDHTLITDILATEADITFCGHDHLGFGDVELNGKHFINPGSVVRMTCAEREFLREPSVVLVTADENGIKTQVVQLPCKPAADVLSRSAVQAAQSKLNLGEEVRKSVEQLRLGGTVLQNVLDDIYTRDAIDPAIRADIQEIILQKTASLRERIAAPTGSSIVRVTFHNFQSHADTEIRPAAGFNVIVGESHNGKSAILRGVRWVAENKPSGKSMIRIGTKEGYVEVELENGTVIRRFVTASDNGYKVTMPDGTVREGNTKMVFEVQRLMGWTPMPIGPDEEIGINHMSQSASPMLIGDNYTGTDRSRIIGSINNTDGIDAAVDEYALENARAAETRKHETARIDTLNEKIEACEKEKAGLDAACTILRLMEKRDALANYLKLVETAQQAQATLDGLTSVYDEAAMNALLTKIRELQRKRASIADYAAAYESESAKSAEAQDAIDRLEPAAAVDIGTIRSMVERKSGIAEQLAKYQDGMARIARIDLCIPLLLPVETISTDAIRRLVERQTRLTELKAEYDNARRISDEEANRIAALTLPDTLTADSIRAQIATLAERRSCIADAKHAYAVAAVESAQSQVDIESAEQKLTALTGEKADLLKKSGTCPLCHSHLDAAAIAAATTN